MFKQLQIPKKLRICPKRPRGRDLHRWISNYGELWVNTWLWEILSITLSGICIILIVVVLMKYDQEPVPYFTYGITLNAVVSTLTTFSKSLFLVAIAGAISQLKWRWFQSTEGRRIIDTQLFDDASRGPWGSLILLATPSRWSLASMGALVSILALAFEPFTQQLTTFPARGEVVSAPGVGPPTLYRARSYLKDPRDLSREILNLKSRFTATLWDTLNETERFATAQCPTGNCTWENFESLAFCTSCQNKTSGLELSDITLSWSGSVAQQAQNEGRYVSFVNKYFLLHPTVDFPCNFAAYGYDPNITATISKSKDYSYASSIIYPRHLFGVSSATWEDWLRGDFRPPKDGFPANSSNFLKWQSRRLPLLRFCHAELESEGYDGPERISARQATLCNLTPCVKNYSFSISNGVPTMDVVGERYGSWYFNTSDYLGLWWADVPGRNGFILNESGTYPYTNLSSIGFSLSRGTTLPFLQANAQYNGQLFFREIFADDVRNRISNSTGIQFKKSFLTASVPFMNPRDAQSSALQRITDNGGLTWAVPRIAAAASRYIRDTGAVPVEGYAHRSIIIVEVRWSWLALPATTWLCGVVFLALTMWVCRGNDQVLWKTSSLPLIYHGFEDRDVAAFETTDGGLERVSGMEKYSQNLYARLQRDSNDGQLKLMRAPPPT
ncbi:hypothetical protein NUW58_g2210 [Xylaria curta]|uniref:Uncharacterized protein n=1 Tax=Xylaria curta TaxID=42375 RepID=A0ACC1PGM3_9PEZI|nr:hypothetical protein NUW58_g2210 [Xylaria curta]